MDSTGMRGTVNFAKRPNEMMLWKGRPYLA
jgi:hypothetical protein